MAICKDCRQEMLNATSCDHRLLIFGQVVYERNTQDFDKNERCHDCGIVNKPGNIHHFGCDVERCPICSGQLISCGHYSRTVRASQDQPKRVRVIWDYKEDPVDKLKEALSRLGLSVYTAPETDGSDSYGIVVAERPLTRAEIEETD